MFRVPFHLIAPLLAVAFVAPLAAQKNQIGPQTCKGCKASQLAPAAADVHVTRGGASLVVTTPKKSSEDNADCRINTPAVGPDCSAEGQCAMEETVTLVVPANSEIWADVPGYEPTPDSGGNTGHGRTRFPGGSWEITLTATAACSTTSSQEGEDSQEFFAGSAGQTVVLRETLVITCSICKKTAI